MDTLVFLIKSYDKHLEWTKHLIESINKHNKDNIKVYLSIPKKDIELFKTSINTTSTLLPQFNETLLYIDFEEADI